MAPRSSRQYGVPRAWAVWLMVNGGQTKADVEHGALQAGIWRVVPHHEVNAGGARTTDLEL